MVSIGNAIMFHAFLFFLLAKEKLIGWYHSGPKLRSSDLEINELFKRYTPNPVLVIVDVKPNDEEIPTDAYFAIEEIKDVSFLL
jgi:26S proteasome regulatory subunit N8